MSKHQQYDKETFAEVFAATNKPIDAMVAAQPNLALNRNYANVKARRELKKPDIQLKIQNKLEKMQGKATKRISELIQSDDEGIATQNSWKVIEHLRGKPVARNLNVNAEVTIEDALLD